MAELIYAVGDIHGSDDLLRLALERIARHAAGRPAQRVFLGDYIDRGPGSREVVARLRALSEQGQAICLKGNHEDLFVRCDQSRSAGDLDHWLGVGGVATMRSYRADRLDPACLDAVPIEDRRWLAALPLVHEQRHHLFVHAGLRPDWTLEAQTDAELLWIRERFLRAQPEAFAERRHIVHGHTPVWAGKPDAAEPERLAHRTNLDTGAYATGVLTIGVFDAAQAGGPVDMLTAG